MSRKKIILPAIGAIIIAIQFIPPARNTDKNGQVLSTDITRAFPVPDSVLTVFKSSCYNCHSNNTDYPWYSNIQPGGWWLAWHIRKGKSELNFNEFGSYSPFKQRSKFFAIENSLKDGTMPLWSYTLIHKEARITEKDKRAVIAWADKMRDSLSLNQP